MTTLPDRHAARRAVAAVLVFGLVAVAACGSSTGTARLPDVELAAASGPGGLNPSTLRELTVINLWATWCQPCKRELPDLERVHADPANPARIIGVNIGDDPASVNRYIDALALTFEQYVDPDGAIEASLQVTTLPATALVGADGRVIVVHQGVLDEAGFREFIARA